MRATFVTIVLLAVIFAPAQLGAIDEDARRGIPRLDLTELNWTISSDWQDEYATGSALDDARRVESFPILPNAIYEIEAGRSLGTYTLHTQFSVPEDDLDQAFRPALFFSGIGENWEVYLNGRLLRSEMFVDYPAQRLERSRYLRNTMVRVPLSALQKENTLVIHLVGYAPVISLAPNRHLGLRVTSNYWLAEEDWLRESLWDQLRQFVLSGIFVFFGLYYLFFFVRRYQSLYNLYFGLFCICLSGYLIVFTNRAFASFEDSSFLIFFGFAIQPICFSLFLLFLYNYYYAGEKRGRAHAYVRLLLHVLNASAFVAYVVLPYRFYEALLTLWYFAAVPQVVYLIAFMIVAIRRKRPDAVAMTMGMVVALLFVLWDILDTAFFHTQFRLVQYSLVAMILSLIVILANRFLALHNESERLNEELALEKDSFARFVPVQFLTALDKRSARDIQPGDSASKDVTVLFSDIRSFTTMAESMEPAETFAFLNGYLRSMEPILSQHQGFVDKYIGDAILALFAETGEGPPSANRALSAAEDMIIALEQHNLRLDRAQEIRIGLGINTGPVIMGTVGSDQRLDTTVIGDTVNLASRLEYLTVLYRVPILFSQHTYDQLVDPDKLMVREIDSVIVRGRTQAIRIYECFGCDPHRVREQKIASKEHMAAALKAYREGEFGVAVHEFAHCAAACPDDPIPRIFMRRCETYGQGQIDPNWDGALVVTRDMQ